MGRGWKLGDRDHRILGHALIILNDPDEMRKKVRRGGIGLPSQSLIPYLMKAGGSAVFISWAREASWVLQRRR